MRTATVVWRISGELVLAMDEHLGPPVDSYVNGSQTWFTGEPVLEWRLHPVAGYETPQGVSPYDLWEMVVDAIAGGADPGAIPMPSGPMALTDLWDGLECFPAYGDELEPVAVVQRVRDTINRDPDLSGLVDHDIVGDEWEHSNGAVSVLDLLTRQLSASPAGPAAGDGD